MRAIRETFDRFFTERGTHLAAMVAYFALMSFVPLVFLALSILGFLDQADSSSALVTYLEDIFPEQSVESIVDVVDAVQRNAATLSVIGAVALLWSSVSLFSALESAFNILYGLPNRPFLRGKGLATIYMSSALVVLFTGLTIGTFGYDLLRRYATDVVSNRWVALGLTILISGAALFLFLLSAYHRLPNARLTWREVMPGRDPRRRLDRRDDPAAAALRLLHLRDRRAAGARDDVPAARLALCDGDHDRLRRRAQLRPRVRRHRAGGAEASRRSS